MVIKIDPPHPANVRTITTQSGESAAAWTCPRCYALVLGEHQPQHDEWHRRLIEAIDDGSVGGILAVLAGQNRNL